MSDRERVAALARALYAELGAAAPGFRADAAVVRTHEAARAFGALALAAEDGSAPTPPDPALSLVLAEAARADDTGWLALFELATVVGPRLASVVAAARARARDGDVGLWAMASDLVSSEIAAAAAALPPTGDAAAWRDGARGAGEALDASGLG